MGSGFKDKDSRFKGFEPKSYLETRLVVLSTVARSSMNEASPALRCDVLSANHNARLAIIERVLILGSLELLALERHNLNKLWSALVFFALQLRCECTDQVLGHNIAAEIRTQIQEFARKLISFSGSVFGEV